MSLQHPAARNQTPETEPLPAELETPTAKLVYMTLDGDTPYTVDELSERLGMQKLVLFETLRTLESKGLVDTDGGCCTAL